MHIYLCILLYIKWGFPGGAVVKNPPALAGDARDAVSILGSGRAPGVGNGNPHQYSCLENSMNTAEQLSTRYYKIQRKTPHKEFVFCI